MNKSQQRAIEKFRRFLDERILDHDREKYGAKITVFEVEPTTYGTAWINAHVEYTKLSTNNVLRFLSHDRWHVHIGKRGAIEAHSGPKSLKQFAGRKFLDVNITKNYCGY